jgi:hypothetical protein
MVRRVVAGLVLGLIVFGAASIVSRGMQNPDFLKPALDSSSDAKAAAMTASLPK